MAVLTPETGLRWLRSQSEIFNRYVLWNSVQPGYFDIGHIVPFALLGYAAARALTGWSSRQLVAMLAVLGAFSEFVQFSIPGRYARVSDFAADVLAGACAVWLARRMPASRALEKAGQ